MFAQESVMEVQKEREAFQKFCEENFDFEHHEQTYFDEQTQCYENDIGEDTESINMAWMAWQSAKAQAVPEGFVLVPQESLKVALFWMHEDIDPWQMGGDSFADLYEHKPILEKALVESQEQSHD